MMASRWRRVPSGSAFSADFNRRCCGRFWIGLRGGGAQAGGGIAQQVGANDDADVLAFEALAGVDAADLVDGFRLHNPAAAVF